MPIQLLYRPALHYLLYYAHKFDAQRINIVAGVAIGPAVVGAGIRHLPLAGHMPKKLKAFLGREKDF